MGGWLRRFLEGIGHRVDGVDCAWAGQPPAPGRWAALTDVSDLAAYDAVFVAVGLEVTGDAIAAIAARRVAAPVFEIASIKSHLHESLAAARRDGATILSLHPMFGPAKSLYEPLTVVHAVLGDAEAERAAVLRLLDHPYLDLVSLPFEHHDRLMGWLLGLSHLTGMLFAGALARSGLDPAELQRAASTSFSRQVATSQSVLWQDAALYYAIQRLNPHRGEVHAALTAALDELTGAVERADRDGFGAAFAEARRTLPGQPAPERP
jgi:chorismate mutase/prephenate dehydrogenase